MTGLVGVAGAVAGKAVPVAMPAGRSAAIASIEPGEAEPERDNASAWSGFIVYTNARGETSARRIVCLCIGGRGRAETIGARCIETRRFKTFRLDRIGELVCAQTGEVLDPFDHFEALRIRGALKIEDKNMTDLARLLMFLARCDGDYHPLEAESLSDALGRYVLRFGGNDRMLETAVAELPKVAPDDMDFVKALDRFAKNSQRRQLARLVLECSSDVIAADGVERDVEVQWALQVSDALKAMAMD